MLLKWGDIKVTGDYAVLTTIDDLANPYVDFSPKESSTHYYMQTKGGAVVSNIERLTKKIIKEKPRLSKNEWKLIEELNGWANKLTSNNHAIYIRGSSKVFETALFQLTKKSSSKIRKKRKKRKYLSSPFGSFEHFKDINKKYGYSQYKKRLETKDFYLRVRSKIPASEIKPYKLEKSWTSK